MKNKINYSNEPVKARVIHDFLPGSGNLVFKNKKIKTASVLREKGLDILKNFTLKKSS